MRGDVPPGVLSVAAAIVSYRPSASDVKMKRRGNEASARKEFGMLIDAHLTYESTTAGRWAQRRWGPGAQRFVRQRLEKGDSDDDVCCIFWLRCRLLPPCGRVGGWTELERMKSSKIGENGPNKGPPCDDGLNRGRSLSWAG